MGWCSATQIMDTALGAAEKAVTEAFRLVGADPDPASLEEIGKKLDDVLRPFVAALARKLHAEDWDCEPDSVYFERFPQEMLEMDDSDFRGWLVEKVGDTDGDQHWADMLTAFNAKTKEQNNGR